MASKTTRYGRLASLCATGVVAASAWLAQAAYAAPYSAVVAFGDSLSDNGNFYAASAALVAAEVLPGQLPQAPYFEGRFSNGPVAVEVMAQRLGIPLVGLAYGGAGTGPSNLQAPPELGPLNTTGLLSQVGGFVAAQGGAADLSALYLVWAGTNDFILGDLSQVGVIITQAVTNLNTAVGALYGAGARHFLLPLMPDLGLTPQAIAAGSDIAAALSAISAAFNDALGGSYLALLGLLPGAEFTVFDTVAAQRGLVASAAAFGITNTTGGCFSGFVGEPGDVCDDPSSYLFWDRQHPTALVHRILGEQFAAAVPAPSALALTLLALALLVPLNRRR